MLYVATHRHEYGTSVGWFQSERNAFDEQEIADVCDFDYEPEQGEEIEYFSAPEVDEVPTL